MDRWEYRDVNINGRNFDDINKLGQQGWEAVGQTEQGTILLKRKQTSSPAQTVQRPVQRTAQNNQVDDDFGISF